MSFDVNLNGQSDEDIENAMIRSGIREAHDDLAQEIKDVYTSMLMFYKLYYRR